jgi:hypothetical protein
MLRLERVGERDKRPPIEEGVKACAPTTSTTNKSNMKYVMAQKTRYKGAYASISTKNRIKSANSKPSD